MKRYTVAIMTKTTTQSSDQRVTAQLQEHFQAIIAALGEDPKRPGGLL